MGKKNRGQETFELGCPHCKAVLKVDPETRAVISHKAPIQPKMFEDLDSAAKAMHEQDSRRDSLFRQSVEAERNKASLLEKKFQDALKRAKESPDEGKPLRDIDLD